MSADSTQAQSPTGAREIVDNMTVTRSIRRAQCQGRVWSALGGGLSYLVGQSQRVLDPLIYLASNFQHVADGMSLAMGQDIVDEDEFNEEMKHVLLPSEIRAKPLSDYIPKGKKLVSLHKQFGRMQTMCTRGQKELAHLSTRDKVIVRGSQVLAVGAFGAASYYGYGCLVGAPLAAAAVLTAGAAALTTDASHAELIIDRFRTAITKKINEVNGDEYRLSQFLDTYIKDLGPIDQAIVAAVIDKTVGATVVNLQSTLLSAVDKTLEVHSTKITDLLEQVRAERLQIMYKLVLRNFKTEFLLNKVTSKITAMILAELIMGGGSLAASQLGLIQNPQSFTKKVLSLLNIVNQPGKAIKGVVANPSVDVSALMFAGATISDVGFSLLFKHGLTVDQMIDEARRLNSSGSETCANIRQRVQIAHSALEKAKILMALFNKPSTALPLLDTDSSLAAEGPDGGAGAGVGAGAAPSPVDTATPEDTSFSLELIGIVTEALSGMDMTEESGPVANWVKQKLLQSSDSIIEILMNMSVGIGEDFINSAAEFGGESIKDANFLFKISSIIQALRTSPARSKESETSASVKGQALIEFENLESIKEKSSELLQCIVKTFVRSLYLDMCAKVRESRVNVAAFCEGYGVGAEKIAKLANEKMAADAAATRGIGQWVGDQTGFTRSGEFIGALASVAHSVVAAPSVAVSYLLDRGVAQSSASIAATIAPRPDGDAIASDEELCFLERTRKEDDDTPIFRENSQQRLTAILARKVSSEEMAKIEHSKILFKSDTMKDLNTITESLSPDPAIAHTEAINILAGIVHSSFYNQVGTDTELKVKRARLNELVKCFYTKLEQLNTRDSATGTQPLNAEFLTNHKNDLYLVVDAALTAVPRTGEYTVTYLSDTDDDA